MSAVPPPEPARIRQREKIIGQTARALATGTARANHVGNERVLGADSGAWVQIDKLTPKEPPVKVTTALAEELRRDAPVI